MFFKRRQYRIQYRQIALSTTAEMLPGTESADYPQILPDNNFIVEKLTDHQMTFRKEI
jgi:hypothetical protein